MIHHEPWYREADEASLSRLLREHERFPSLETARELWKAYLREGKLPPLEWTWVGRLLSTPDVEAPTFPVEYYKVLYGYSQGEEAWVPWGPSQEHYRWEATPGGIRNWVRNMPTWHEHLFPPNYEPDFPGGGKAMIKFEELEEDVDPRAFGGNPPYEQRQWDYILEIETSPENARQLFRWAQE